LTTPLGSKAVVIDSACGVVKIEIVKDFWTTPAGDAASCNRNIGVVVTRTVGVPTIAPVVAFNERPAGRAGDPLARLHV
jgi:hypothetical protein